MPIQSGNDMVEYSRIYKSLLLPVIPLSLSQSLCLCPSPSVSVLVPVGLYLSCQSKWSVTWQHTLLKNRGSPILSNTHHTASLFCLFRIFFAVTRSSSSLRNENDVNMHSCRVTRQAASDREPRMYGGKVCFR